MEKHAAVTYSGILGLVVAAPIAMLYNTGAWREVVDDSILRLLVGIVLLVVGFAAIYLTNKAQDKNAQ